MNEWTDYYPTVFISFNWDKLSMIIRDFFEQKLLNGKQIPPLPLGAGVRRLCQVNLQFLAQGKSGALQREKSYRCIVRVEKTIQ